MYTTHRVYSAFEHQQLPDKLFGTGNVAVGTMTRWIEYSGCAYLLR